MQRVSIRASLTAVVTLFMAFASGVTPAAAGTLKVTSFPTGAEVIVDGVNTGKLTPMNISLADGDHVVTVQIPGSGWNPDTRTVTIGAGNNDLSVTLLPMMTVGPAGPKGDKGDKGDPGAPGVNGTNGLDGASLVSFGVFAGNLYGCPNGGALFGALTPSGGALIQTPLCNGLDGVDGSATRADGPCFDNVNRYVDCGNGTVTDTVTGLIWLKDAECLTFMSWAAGNQAAAGLKDGDCGLTDRSSPGDWRLPTKDEWSATIARALALGCIFDPNQTEPGGPVVSLTNDAGTECWGTAGSSSFALPNLNSWSSTTHETAPGTAWYARLGSGGLLGNRSKVFLNQVWPVRSGTR